MTIDAIGVSSPDTVTGRVRANDPDGIDSVWLEVDSLRFGQEGFFDPVFDAPFVAEVPSGLPFGARIDLRFEARDALGMVSTVDTFVTVVTAARAARR